MTYLPPSELMSEYLEGDTCSRRFPGAVVAEVEESEAEKSEVEKSEVEKSEVEKSEVEKSGVEKSEVEKYLPLDVRYACRNWVEHLCQSFSRLQRNQGLTDGGEVCVFLQGHLLHWLEALNLTGNMSDGVMMVRALESLLK
ncbi:MAG: hypothetical protein M1839_008891, partial [Geoglossum umbratile]